jgi:transposase
MQGRRDRWQEELFVASPLRALVPEDHVLKRVDAAVDFSWIGAEVADCYSASQGRPSIDPESALRLMLAGFFQGIVHDRRLLREAQVNLAIRWFAGYGLHEALPHHSSLTRIRQRWGAERFKRIFQRTVQECVKAGLVNADTVHVDATLVRADVSWASIVEVHSERVVEENDDDDGPGGGGPASGGGPGRPKKPARGKRHSTTDPDATMTTSKHSFHMEPYYKQHTAVEDRSGIIVDVAVETGEASEGAQLMDQLGRVETNTGQTVTVVTADKAYAHAGNYKALAERETEAIIPPQRVGRPKKERIPKQRFKYDAHHETLRCPAGNRMRRCASGKNGTWYRARPGECAACALRKRCVPPTAQARSIRVVDGYADLIRARRRHAQRLERDQALYTRHRWRVEGVHGRAKTQHGLGRAIRRGLDNVAIQAYLTAAVMNLKTLAKTGASTLFSPLAPVIRLHRIARHPRHGRTEIGPAPHARPLWQNPAHLAAA